MIMSLKLNGAKYSINTERGYDISIPLQFNGPQPNFFGVDPAKANPYESGSIIGDTKKGGSCNFETVHFTPQCSGTHTECVGHIVDQDVHISDLEIEPFIPAVLLSFEPLMDSETTDKFIDAEILEKSMSHVSQVFLKAVIIRTIPNSPEKITRTYKENEIPPYLTEDAVQYLLEKGTEHLLVDVPSVDRAYDDGKLAAHHLFWDIPAGSHQLGDSEFSKRTITELIFVPDDVEDGEYILNLQTAHFKSDAAPSRPILYEVTQI
ncbi:MAG: cyclase family protein [Candidatus Marinimicrobia bacterium]|jgi:kynurenine formamidase|nr:cyclase family protein [Candidatus Neomarinimicrobiota bacterium]MDP6789913.1 cyclase family protein [Candidatus Neomarinimicrobiota bacterium]MDP7072831.1 cyclase family protein [Candidatus Neomarinimicrobiota bacterium]